VLHKPIFPPTYPGLGPPPAPLNTHNPQKLRYQCLFRVAAPTHQCMRKLRPACFQPLNVLLGSQFLLSSGVHRTIRTWIKRRGGCCGRTGGHWRTRVCSPIRPCSVVFCSQANRKNGYAVKVGRSRYGVLGGGLGRDVDTDEILTFLRCG